MRFIVTIIWAALISGVLSYILSHMTGSTFELTNVIVLTVIISLTVFILGEGLIKTNEE